MTIIHENIQWLSALELSQRLSRKEFSCEELCESIIEHIHKVNPLINAIVSTRDQEALADARAADSVPQENRGPLHGIPFTVKDTSGTVDLPTSFGSVPLRDYYPKENDPTVQAMLDAGAILIGKTNTPEFAMRPPSTVNDLFGQTKNPWNLDHSPGGSSGGAAAAAAAGMGPLAEGGDTGGSIRGPASCCGVVGMKPSYGLVSSAPFYDGACGMLTKGSLTRTVRDAALMLDVLTNGAPGPFPASHLSSTKNDSYIIACDTPIRPARIAYVDTPPIGESHPEVNAVLEDIVNELRGAGHSLFPIELPLKEFSKEHQLIFHVWNATQVLNYVSEDEHEQLTEWTRNVISRFSITSAFEYCTAVDKLKLLIQKTLIDINRFDLIISPTIACLPPSIASWPSSWSGEEFVRDVSQMVGFTSIWNDIGLPAISIPSAFSSTGLPIGIQIIGQYARERDVLSAASWLEERLLPDLYRKDFPVLNFAE